MAASTKVWVNNSPPQCAAEDLNGFETENNNLIKSAGMAPDTSDNLQTASAVAAYAANGDFYVDSGVANAYVLSPQDAGIIPYAAPPAYFMGMRVRFIVGVTNTGASTVNVASLGAISIVDRDGSALDGGDLVANKIVTIVYDDSVSPKFILTDAGGSSQGLTTGMAIVNTANDIPDSTQYIDAGGIVSRTTYLNLYSKTLYPLVGNITNASAVVTGLSTTTKLYVDQAVEGTNIPAGTTIASIDSSTQITLSANATATASATLKFFPYGNGDGSTTFGTWNPAGRSPIGAGQGSGLTNRAPGETGGTEETIQTEDTLFPHDHGVGNSMDYTAVGSGGMRDNAAETNHTTTRGGGQPMATMNPWIGTKWIIKI